MFGILVFVPRLLLGPGVSKQKNSKFASFGVVYLVVVQVVLVIVHPIIGTW